MNALTQEISSLLGGRGIPFRFCGCMAAEVVAINPDIEILEASPQGRSKVYFIVLEQRSHTIEEAAAVALEVEKEAGWLEGETMVVAEDMWRSHHSLVSRRILAHCGVFASVFARNCEIRRIERPAAEAFLMENHSYGGAKMRHCYGLFLKRHTGHLCSELSENLPTPGEMVAVATFSNARRWDKGGKIICSYEWVRYASLSGVRVCGGMGKMLKRFISDVKPDDIMTYADLEWSSGETYKELGFELEGRKEAVDFSIDTVSWRRTALNRLERSGLSVPDGNNPEIVFYRNRGSLKYRIKLTEY
ncbi:MAG: hypothetical protein ACI3ZN_05740 [Candidatus Cryptobacteroides sp.]